MSESDSKIAELEKEKSDCDTSVKDFEAKLDKYNKQMDMVTNNKEYDALLVEIDHLKNENNTLVDKILEIEESIEGLNNFKKECDEKITSLNEKLNENESELHEKSVEFDVEEKLLLKDKNSLLSNIVDKDFIDSYENDERELIAPVYNGSCSSCYTSLPAQTLLDIRKGLRLIRCPNCSIFLYSDE
jgi:predicted  nucleic acid-binding Zn-ribbon protein